MRHAVAYFFAKDVSFLPQMLVAPLVYCVVFLAITSPRYDDSWCCFIAAAASAAPARYLPARQLPSLQRSRGCRGSFSAYYTVLLGVYYTASGFAYLVSLVVPAGLAQLVGVVTIFSNSMFAGGAPVLKQLLRVRRLCCMRRIES
jgi:hypothetical protein